MLAQVDSSIGGKTAVDTAAGKNLLGTFYQPKAVFIDIAFLRTLPDEYFRSGLAEVIKYGVIEAPELLDEVEAAAATGGLRDPAFLERVIGTACRIKKGIVEIDEQDRGIRRILNFGHTVGHAVEAASDYRLSHGESVAIGMVAAGILARQLHYLPADDCQRIAAVVRAAGLPDRIPKDLKMETILSRMTQDKKKTKGHSPFCPPQETGGPLHQRGHPGGDGAGNTGRFTKMKKERLDQLREKIEQTDRRLVELLNERAAVSIEIGKAKRDTGKEVYDPAREALVYGRLTEASAGPLTEAPLKAIFREIISASRALQAPLRVAFLGPEASFSHQAALAHFGSGIDPLPKATIRDVFDEVERGQNGEWGIVPVENSAEGSVKATLDRLISTPLAIRGGALPPHPAVPPGRRRGQGRRSERSALTPRPSPNARAGCGTTCPACR